MRVTEAALAEERLVRPPGELFLLLSRGVGEPLNVRGVAHDLAGLDFDEEYGVEGHEGSPG